MKITLINIGKTDISNVNEGVKLYEKRIKKYIPFEIIYLPDIKNRRNINIRQQQETEGKFILKAIEKADCLILLDEKGKVYSSVEFSGHLQELMNRSVKHLIFVTGGPYGFSEEVYARASELISLSRMTFSHQLVRLIFTEQLYRAMTIIKGEPYHHS
jgi:23S rRNA (pseudouridine1915-N3)-methyltransferase